MRLSQGIREKLVQEGLVSYLDARRSLKMFEQEIVTECTDAMKSKINKLGVRFHDDVVEDLGAADDGFYIGVGVFGVSEKDYMSLGVWWESGVASAYVSRYVGDSKKLANSLFNELVTKLRVKDLEKEGSQQEGWYFSLYRKLASHRGKNLENALNEVLRAWIRIEPKFIEFRKRFR